MIRFKNLLSKNDVIDSCRKRNTNWKVYQLTNVTFFAASLKEYPMVCKDTLLTEHLLRNFNINCLTFERNTRQPYNDNLCLFRDLALHTHGNEGLEEETSQVFNLFPEKTGGTEPANIRGVCIEDIEAVEDFVQVDNFQYDIDILDASMFGELAGRSIRKYFNTVRLLRYNSHIWYVSNISVLFKAYRCPSCDQFNKRSGSLERHLTTCKERVEVVFRKNVYQVRETLFDNLELFNISCSDEKQLFNNMEKFDFESTSVQKDKFCDTDTTTWIGKHFPIYASISSLLTEQLILFCNSNLGVIS